MLFTEHLVDRLICFVFHSFLLFSGEWRKNLFSHRYQSKSIWQASRYFLW